MKFYCRYCGKLRGEHRFSLGKDEPCDVCAETRDAAPSYGTDKYGVIFDPENSLPEDKALRDELAEAYATGNHRTSFPDTHDERAFKAGYDACMAATRSEIMSLKQQIGDMTKERDELLDDFRTAYDEAQAARQHTITEGARSWRLLEALRRYAHIPIANDERNSSSAPSNQNFIAREAIAEYEAKP